MRRLHVTVVLRALGLGDLLTGFPALRGVRAARPDDLVVLLTTPGVAPLARLAALADQVVAVDELAPLPFRGPVDLTVNLHGRGPRSHELLGALSPRASLGFDLAGGPDWPSEVHEVERWCALVDHLLGDAERVDRRALDLSLPDVPIAIDEHLTVVHPGASAAARRWPPDRWSAVARFERARGHEVVVTGGRSERALSTAVAMAAGLPPSANLSGCTNVVELAELVAGAGRVVCGDTGVAHLATAFRRPSVVLFGPTDPRCWGPPSNRAEHRVLWHGSTGEPNAIRVDEGLLQITVDEVCGALVELDTSRLARVCSSGGDGGS